MLPLVYRRYSVDDPPKRRRTPRSATRPTPEREERGRQYHNCETCGTPTRFGKPYCLAHILNSPYAAEVQDELARRGLLGGGE